MKYLNHWIKKKKSWKKQNAIPGKSSAAQGLCWFPCSEPLTRSLKQPWSVQQRSWEELEREPWASAPVRTNTMMYELQRHYGTNNYYCHYLHQSKLLCWHRLPRNSKGHPHLSLTKVTRSEPHLNIRKAPKNHQKAESSKPGYTNITHPKTSHLIIFHDYLTLL